ncbi:MAG: alpha-glucan family phosphorylase [Acidimicrobiia bacterium]|nr:alpha-glucan family phosphorylase [Acidimicrobiia bacterium]
MVLSYGDPVPTVAYFSPEFGVSADLPQYSGGLGVLAGDHLKGAADMGLALVGIGLFYDHGYFHQRLDGDGWQQEAFPALDPGTLPLAPVDARVGLELAGEHVDAEVWRYDVGSAGSGGSVPLYLLHVDGVTDRLYGGDVEHRLRQEIVLGVGGVRLLGELGVDAGVFHSNEGHAGFLTLERIRRAIVNAGLSFDDAVASVRPGGIFTTHTPVPAGIDRFPRHLMEKYFGSWASECGVDVDRLMALGHFPGEAPDAPFNMAVLGLRLASRANAVSELHAEVSRAMFAALDVRIDAITNGVHVPTWAPQRPSLEGSNGDLWASRAAGRRRLVEAVRGRAGVELQPDVLTIGFARRFAAYKRATLLLSQPERLEALLLSHDRPVQLVFAGKAHPADHEGKELIQQVARFARRPEVRHRMAFVEDYDIALGRCFYEGSDVWLNTPRRPHEACGTSGMKAVLNGAVHCSVLDGWWPEMYDGTNGWAIPSFEDEPDQGHRDHLEATALFELLEGEIVPTFYDRDAAGLPLAWLDTIRASLRSLAPRVTAERMLGDYVERMYEPAASAAARP